MGLFSQPGLFLVLSRETQLQLAEGPAAVEVYGRVARAYHASEAELTPELQALLNADYAEIDKLKAQGGRFLGAMLTALIPPAMALTGPHVALMPDHLTQRRSSKRQREYLLWAFAPQPLPGKLQVSPQGLFFPLKQLFFQVQDLQIGDAELDKGAVIQGDDAGQVMRWLGAPALKTALKSLLPTGVEWRLNQAGVGAVLDDYQLRKPGTLGAWVTRLTNVARAFPT